MFCGNCGTKIPDGATRCPSCGWQKTTERPAPVKKSRKPGPQPKPHRKSKPRRPAPRFTTVAGCFTAGVVAVILFLTGTVLLFNHRGFAWEAWKTSDAGLEEKAAEEQEPIMELRDELLSISARISGMEKGLPYNPVKIKKRLAEIEKELKNFEDDPVYFRVFALHKSVLFQFNLTEESELQADIPPLPYSPYAPKPTEEYVMADISPKNLLKNKILKGGSSKSIRYGPALFGFDIDSKEYSKLFNIDAPKFYKYVEVTVKVEGNVDLVEYTTRVLDDYRRAFPPFLGAEKEARKKSLPKNHLIWRDVSKTEKNKPLYLHRIFLLPQDTMKKPILVIQRQGSSKMIWIQY